MWCSVSIASGVVLWIYTHNLHLTVYILGLILTAFVAQSAVRYLVRRRFYQSIETATKQLEEPYLIADVVQRPYFWEGAMTWDTLSIATKAMVDKVKAHERTSREYRDYIETWIHEVKTPIAAAHLIASNTPTPDVEKMDTEVHRIERYVEQALYYARSDALDRDYVLEAVHVDDLVKQALRRNASMLVDSGLTIQWEGDGLHSTVYTDSKWVVFILGQLLTNSAKYVRPGYPPVVRISADQTEEGESGRVRTQLRVADNGMGISAEDLPRVFDKAFTGARGRHFVRSTGMGLYISKRLCDTMGIGLELASQRDFGTTATLTFVHQEDEIARGARLR